MHFLKVKQEPSRMESIVAFLAIVSFLLVIMLFPVWDQRQRHTRQIKAMHEFRQPLLAHDLEQVKMLMTKKDLPWIWGNDERGEFLYWWAVKAGDVEVVEWLISIDKYSNFKDHYHTRNGWYSIHLAAFENNMEMVKCLIQRGARADQIQHNPVMSEEDYMELNLTFNLTPICIAARNDNLEMVKYLMEQGADPNVNYYKKAGDVYPQNQTALEILRAAHHDELVKWVEEMDRKREQAKAAEQENRRRLAPPVPTQPALKIPIPDIPDLR